MSGETFQHEFFETTSVTDFILKDIPEPPRGYPQITVEDGYIDGSFPAEYDERRAAFIEHVLSNPAPQNIKGFFYELVRIAEKRGPVHEGLIASALSYIASRYDCADFVLLGIMRLMYQFPSSGEVSDSLYREAEETILGFKYWPDEPGIDSMCSWTENHQIMFSVNEYLAGKLYPERVFSNSGQTGLEKIERARKRILEWLELRYRTGFNEWLSNVYYDEDMTALLNLIDFSEDDELVARATIVLDLLLFDMAVNSFHGMFVSSHGRCYTKEKKSALVESTIDTAKLLFGCGVFSGADNMSAVAFALSPSYRMPEVLYRIANDTERPSAICRQRAGIRIRDAKRWGLGFRSAGHGMTLLSFEAYAHPKTFRLTMRLFDRFRWWENRFFSDFRKNRTLIDLMRYTGLDRLVTRYFEKDLTRNTREEVNLYTFRTPDYQLSSAQDYRKGYGGDQQHIWQATLGPEAVCFTTHPGGTGDGSPGYWVGSGTLPRVAQYENVLFAVYNISHRPGLYRTNSLFFTHAWVPREAFDEVVEENGWIFARRGEGYLGLYSANPYRWQRSGAEAGSEVISEGDRNIWICEMGRAENSGSFSAFIEAVANATIEHRGLRIRYHSPSQGLLEFGWNERLRRDGVPVELSDYYRYENPYCLALFPPDEILIREGDSSLRVDFAEGLRDADGCV